MFHPSNKLFHLSDQVFQLPAFPSFGKMRVKDPNSDVRIFELLNRNLDKYQAQLSLFFLVFHYGT